MASLDPLARREFLQGLMEAIAEDGTSVVLSSHLITDIERLCDYLVVLTGSRIRVVDPAAPDRLTAVTGSRPGRYGRLSAVTNPPYRHGSGHT